MLVMRPVRDDDLERLAQLAKTRTFGLTTLPDDRGLLQRRIAESQRTFDKVEQEPRGESFLLVMDDTEVGHVVGTSGIVSKVGGFEPFYAYRVETSVHRSEMLNFHKEIKALHLVADHNGPCEIGSLFLLPSHRGGGRGKLLSLSRFLFMADHVALFDPVVIAEMRGVIDEQGRSPFWDALGKHFFEIDFPHADYLSIVNKRFIADLMPKHPIYVPLLPPDAQAVIGEVHERTRPALKMLESEGFSLSGMVDIFEAGPVVSCPLDQIRTVCESVRADVRDITERPADTAHCLIANTRRDFRACQAKLDLSHPDRVSLDQETAEVLMVDVGDVVRYASLQPTISRHQAARAASAVNSG